MTIDELINSYNYDYYDGTINITLLDDYMLDQDSDGINDTLVINLTTDVSNSVTYLFIVNLQEKFDIIQNYTNKTISTSDQSAQIYFDTKELTLNKYNYSVELRRQDYSLAYMKYRTQTNYYDNYEEGVSIISISDQSVGNNLIRISVNFNITENRTSNVTVFLSYNNKTISSTKEASLTTPSQIVDIDLDNETIKSTHFNGTYTIESVKIGEKILETDYNTSSYNYEDFAKISYIQNIVSDTFDNNSNNLSEALRFNFTLNIKEAETYTIEAALYDTSNNRITTISKNQSLNSGTQKVTIEIPGEDIYSTYYNGKFLLSFVKLSVENNTKDIIYDAHVTNITYYTDFERPPLADLTIAMNVFFSEVNNETNITINVTNRGEVPAFNIFVDIFDNSTYENQSSTDFLDVNQSKLFNFIAPNITNETIFIAIVDFDNFVDESNEENNIVDNRPINPAPIITRVSASPTPQGFGENITITANITDINGTQDIDTVLVGIIPPGENETNYTMYNISSSTWQYIFTDFTNGTYQYTVYVNDTSGLSDSKSGTFDIFVDLYINIKTLKDNYTNNEFVNITDPQGYSFNNSKTAENLTFTGNENISRYLTIPLEIIVNNFNMTLASYEKNSTCYQEFSNVTVECNNATLKGSYDGSGYQWVDLYKAYDGDYTTNASCDPSFGCAIYFNYTLERNITSAVWQIGNETHIVNKTLPQNCINYANSVNKLQLEMTSNSLPGFARYHCHIDASTTTLVYQYNSINVYEEGIFLITYTPPVNNPYLVIDTSYIWNYSGTFTGPNITNNLSSFINEALNSQCNCSNCWNNGTHCTIQFLFHSDTAGILEYSNINLDYEAEDFSESKIRNDASINTSVYLLMKVQFWNNSNWPDEVIIQNDTSPRRIQPGEINQLKLDSIWNPNAWYTNYNKYGSGTYRAYVAATDENDNILLNKDGTPIISSYNFTLNVTIADDNKKFIIKNESGEIKAWFGDKGNIILKGICLALTDCIPPANSFIIQNSTGETVAYIDSEGNLCIEKGDCSDLSPYCNASNGLIITNSSDIVSYIDMEGDLCLTGRLYLYS